MRASRRAVASARRWGYAFVREHYRPHITLGFDARLAAGAAGSERREHPHAMRVERVLAVTLADPGRLLSVLAL